VANYETAFDAASLSPTVTALTEIEGELAFAELAHACGKREEAAKIYQRLGRRSTDQAEVARALGLLALAENRLEEARKHFEVAMRAPSPPADVYFEYAMMARDAGAPRDEYLAYLRKAIAANPNYAEAHFLIGSTLSAMNRHEEALPHLERAASIFPRQSYFWHALAVGYQAVGREADSKAAASRALDSAVTSEQAEMARAALQLAPSQQATSARKPDVIVPESWRRNEGDAKVSGVLEKIDCLGESARFVIRANGQMLPLLVEKPGDVLLKNLSSVTFEFRCGAQKPAPVTVEYRNRPDQKLGVAGIVTAIEFQ
jgi:tetratricopeptide (TPR) repeat protein